MRNMSPEQAANEIRRAYDTWATQGGEDWMLTAEIFDRADLSLAEATAGVSFLNRHDRSFHASPDYARNERTEQERACFLPLGDDQIGLVSWR